MNYKIVSGKSITEIMTNVNDEVIFGWKPVGGICCAVTPIGVMFYQAMVI